MLMAAAAAAMGVSGRVEEIFTAKALRTKPALPSWGGLWTRTRNLGAALAPVAARSVTAQPLVELDEVEEMVGSAIVTR